MTKKQPQAITAVTAALIKIGSEHGIEAVHQVYTETIAELMACRERDAWRSRVRDAQGEMFALLGTGY